MEQNPINIKIETFDNKPEYQELVRLENEYIRNNTATYILNEWWGHPTRGHYEAFVFKNGKYFRVFYSKHEACDENRNFVFEMKLHINEITKQNVICDYLSKILNDIRGSKEKLIEVDSKNQIRDIELNTEAKIKAFTEKMNKLKDKKIQTIRKIQSKQESDLPKTVESRFKELWIPKP